MSGSVSKKPNFFRVAKKRIKLVWKGTSMNPSTVAHPIEFYKSLEKGRKMRSPGKKTRKRGKGYSIGTTIRARVVSGPELNILFLGIPFLIDCAVTTAQLEHKRKKEKRKNKLLKLVSGKSKHHKPEPLPQAPYSDKFSKVRDQLVEMGMSPGGAEIIASGELGEDPAEDHLDEHDLGVLAAWLQLDTVGETENDEEELEEVLSE